MSDKRDRKRNDTEEVRKRIAEDKLLGSNIAEVGFEYNSGRRCEGGIMSLENEAGLCDKEMAVFTSRHK